MTLQEWIDEWNARHGRGGKTMLFRRSGATWDTIGKVLGGEPLNSVETATRLSAATDGQVSAEWLLGLDRAAPSMEDDADA